MMLYSKIKKDCLPWAGRKLSTLIGLTGGLIAVCAAAQTAPESLKPSDRPAAEVKVEPAAKSIVKILSVLRYPDLFQPWTKNAPVSSAASGVVIEGNRILTTAHAVAYASELQIQANDNGDKVTATVEAFTPEVDLAVLKLDDNSFFASHPPLKRAARLPQINDKITAWGFPADSTKLVSGSGKVVRIDYSSALGGSSLRIQMDSSVPSGAGGGAAMVGDTMIGLLVAPTSKTDKAGYIISGEEIDSFLNATRAGSYHGHPSLNLVLQGFKLPALRSFLGVDSSIHGVVVQQVGPTPAGNPLREWDIITQVGKGDLDDDGTIALDNGIRVGFTYLLGKTVVDGKVPMTVVRSGKPMHVEVPVQTSPPRLLPGLDGVYPDYFVYGPIVFSDASQDLFYNLVSTLVGGNSGVNGVVRLLQQDTPLATRCTDFPKFEGERLVVVTSFFQHKLSEGYPNPVSQVVKAINGIPIKNLAHLTQVLRDCKEKFVSIEFFGRYANTLVFPRAEMVASIDTILTDNNVRSLGSPDIMAVWNAKKPE